jgi:hypothetical protein
MTDDLKTEVGEAGARLRALVAKWREKADEMCPVIPPSKLPRRGFSPQQHYDRTLGAVLATCADELDALLSAPVVSPPQEPKQPNPCPVCGAYLWGDTRPCWNCKRLETSAPVVTQEGESPCP